MQELGNVLNGDAQHALVLKILNATLRLLVEAVEGQVAPILTLRTSLITVIHVLVIGAVRPTHFYLILGLFSSLTQKPNQVCGLKD